MKKRARVALVALIATGLLVGGMAAVASSGPIPIESTPVDDASKLECGDSPVLVTHAGYYIPGGETGKSLRTADAALNRYLASVYPGAQRTRAFRKAREADGEAKYEHRGPNGELRASVLIVSTDGEYHLGEFALCETLAKEWAK